MPQLTILGSGPAFDPDLPNTSLLLEAEPLLGSGGVRILLDCGFASVQPIWRHSQTGGAIDPDFLDGIWLSHAHADHTFGLAPLLMLMRYADRGKSQRAWRERPLTIAGPEGIEAHVRALLDIGYPGQWEKIAEKFALNFQECTAGAHNILGFEVETARTRHGQVLNLASVWSAGEKKLFGYSGDGALTPGSRALLKGVPVLLHDCYAPADDRTTDHEKLETLLQFAEEEGIPKLVLLHTAYDRRSELQALLSTQRFYRGEVLLPLEALTLDL